MAGPTPVEIWGRHKYLWAPYWLAQTMRAILHGCQPAELNAHKLMADTRAPIDWHEQRAGLGFV